MCVSTMVTWLSLTRTLCIPHGSTVGRVSNFRRYYAMPNPVGSLFSIESSVALDFHRMCDRGAMMIGLQGNRTPFFRVRSTAHLANDVK